MSKNQFNRIPAELRSRAQWVVWRYEETAGGKPTKVPYCPHKRAKADVTNPETWGMFEDACNAVIWANGALDGIGFVFTENDPYAGIDLDGSNDPDVIARQKLIFEKFDSYSERSVSGTGLHIIIKAQLLCGRRKSNIELYSANRFFTMTGDVFHDAPIADRQDLANVLWEEMGKGKIHNGYEGTLEERETDDEIIKIASNAVNGEKFNKLHSGAWRDLYQSQSEADFAFIDIIAFYTQSRNQIIRIFRNSVLGQRDKAKRADYCEYMLNKCFDRMLPPIDIAGLNNRWNADMAIARQVAGTRYSPELAEGVALQPATGQALEAYSGISDLSRPVALSFPGKPEGKAAAFEAASDGSSPSPGTNPYTLPPGLLGEIASFIYQAAPRPVPEIALAAAIGLMAGITGRAYNVNGMGLNQYIVLLSQTGNGKEAMASGIDKLMASIRTEMPAAKNFVGPSLIASGVGLLKHLNKQSTSFVSIIGEIGLRMQQLADPRANAAEKGLQQQLLDLYNKSGSGRTIPASAHSQKDNGTDLILEPAVTLLGESTPEQFYSGIDETIIASGLLPRFSIIEYNGKRQYLNLDSAKATVSDDLRNKFATLIDNCLKLNNGINSKPLAINVEFTPEAWEFFKNLDTETTDYINSADSGQEILRHLWNRADVKARKLAALVAVGVNPYMPTITLEFAKWAEALVKYDVKKIYDRFLAGDFGKTTEESKQANEVRRIMQFYVTSTFKAVSSYVHDEKMHKHRIIPYAYLNKRLSSVAAFRLDKIGAANALKRTLQTLLDSGFIGEIGKSQMMREYDTSQRAFCVLDSTWLRREKGG